MWKLDYAIFKVKTVIFDGLLVEARVNHNVNLLVFLRSEFSRFIPLEGHQIIWVSFDVVDILLSFSNETCDHSDGLFFRHIFCSLRILLLFHENGLNDSLCLLLISESLGLKFANTWSIGKRFVKSNENIGLLFHHNIVITFWGNMLLRMIFFGINFLHLRDNLTKWSNQ